jgi:RHS repeat-associated protein
MRNFRTFIHGTAGRAITAVLIIASAHAFADPSTYLYAVEAQRAKEDQIRAIAEKMHVDPEFLLHPEGKRRWNFSALFTRVSQVLGLSKTADDVQQPADIRSQIDQVKSRYALVAADTTLAKIAELLQLAVAPPSSRGKRKGQIRSEMESVLRLVDKDFLPPIAEGLPSVAASRDAATRASLTQLRGTVKSILNQPHALDDANLDTTLAQLRTAISGTVKLRGNGNPRWVKDPFPVKDSYKKATLNPVDRRYATELGPTPQQTESSAIVGRIPVATAVPSRPATNAVAPEVAAFAQQLRTPAKAFSFVYDNVDWQSYGGVAKGAPGTLQERRGNDWDQALLLRDLLQAQGYQAQLEWGRVTLPIARAMNLVGTEDPMQAANLLATAGFDSVALTQNGSPVAIQMTHAWVRALIPYVPNRGATADPPDTWVRMDPSFKKYVYQQGIAVPVPWDEAAYLQTSALRAPEDFYSDKLWDYIRTNNLNCNNLAQVPKSGAVAAANYPFVPATLNTRIEQLSGLAAQPPANMLQTVSLSISDPFFGDVLTSYSANLVDLWGKKLSITFPPATADDAAIIASYGGLYNTPAYLVHLKAVISIDDQIVAQGGSVGAGADLSLDLQFREPRFTDATHHDIVAGENMAEVFDSGRTPDSLIAARVNRLEQMTAQPPATDEQRAAIETERLNLIGLRYMQEVDDAFDFATGVRWQRWVKSAFEGLVTARVQVLYNFIGSPIRITPADHNIDVTRVTVGIVPIQNDLTPRLNAMALAGLHSSYLEGAIWEEVEAQQGISATKALLLSRMAGQRIYTADASNVDSVLASINLSPDVEAEIRGSVGQGRIAIVPSAQIRVNKWVGTGFILRDPISGSTTYPISGGFAGGSGTGGGTSGTDDTFGRESWLGSLDDLLAALNAALAGNPGGNAPSTLQFDPVNVSNGNMLREILDLSILARGIPARLLRTYNSRSAYNGPFGYGWAATYGDSLTPLAGGSLLYRESDGTEHVFTANATGFTSPPGKHIALTASATGYEMRFKDGTKFTFDTRGLLVSQSDLNGNTVGIQRDAAGLPSSVIDDAGRTVLTFTVADGKVRKVTDLTGRFVSYEYNGDDLVTAIDTAGGIWKFDYDFHHNMTKYTDAIGHSQAYDYDTDDRLMHHVDALGAEEFFHYDLGSRKSVVTDRRGGDRLIAFDPRGRATMEADPAGNMVQATFDADNNRTGMLDSRGFTTSYEFDANGNVTREVNPDAGQTVSTYDANSHVLTMTDPAGMATANTYDASGNLTQAARTVNGVTETTINTYDSDGQILTVKDPNGATTTNIWGDNGMITSRTDDAGVVTTISSDPLGRVTAIVDASLSTTRFSYDAGDRLLSTTDPYGAVSSYTYDAAGHRLTLTTPDGITRYEYDAEGRGTAMTDPTGGRATTTYNLAGDVLARSDARGSVTRFEYDGVGRVKKMIDPNGGVWTFDYCAAVGSTQSCAMCTSGGNNFCEIVDPAGHHLKREFDAMGRVISITDSLNNVSRTEYDKAGRVIAETDANGRTKRFTYDESGRVLTVLEANNALTTFTYDHLGNRLSYKNANGNTWTYRYDSLSRLLEEKDSLGRSTTYTYDALGNVKTRTDAKGQTITVDYNVRRPVKLTYPDGSTDTFDYDVLGRRTAMANANVGFTYRYDTLGRLTSATNTRYNLTATYTYDAAGNRIKMVTPQSTVQYTYDAKNRLTAMTDSLFGAFGFSYDAMDRRTELRYPNGITVNYAYDAAYRLTSMVAKNNQAAILDAWAYQYDAVGNRTGKVDMAGIAETYQYDAVDRLTNVQYGSGAFERFTHDAVGNRLTSTTTAGSTTYSYNIANQLLSGGGETFVYDNNGNVTSRTSSRGTTQYTYDFRDRVTNISGPDGTETNLFAPDGSRVDMAGTSIENGRVRVFSDLNRNPILDWGTDNQTWTYRLYGPGIDEPLAEWRRTNNRITYLLRDGLGSITAVTTTDGQVAYRQTYEAFGRMTRTADPSGIQQTRLGYTSRELSIGSLMFNRARHYDTALGRFLQQDPDRGEAMAPPSLHRYVYTFNNPIKYIDPLGQNPIFVALGEFLIIVAAVVAAFVLGYLIGVAIRQAAGGPGMSPDEDAFLRGLMMQALILAIVGVILVVAVPFIMANIWLSLAVISIIGYIGWCISGLWTGASGRRYALCVANIWCAIMELRRGNVAGVYNCLRRGPQTGF